jgi:hypothetical protein
VTADIETCSPPPAKDCSGEHETSCESTRDTFKSLGKSASEVPGNVTVYFSHVKLEIDSISHNAKRQINILKKKTRISSPTVYYCQLADSTSRGERFSQ